MSSICKYGVIPMKKNKFFKQNSGFTLVELLVVVIILVILATLLIPAFTKYFTKNYLEKQKEEAKNILQSSQALFYDFYAEGTHDSNEKCAVPESNVKTPSDSECDIKKTTLARKIFSMSNLNIDKDDPCCVMIAVGKYSKYANPLDEDYDPEKAYHVYFVVFNKYFNRNGFILMDDGTVEYSWPCVDTNGKRITNADNIRNNKRIIVKGEQKPVELQFYYVKSGKDNNTEIDGMWNYIKGRIKSSGF